MNNYSKMTQEEYDEILAELIDDTTEKASYLLTVPGIYEILSEEYNNWVLETWENRNM
jgi:uncharacterized membrane protein